jgi:FkbM family methyltransferase
MHPDTHYVFAIMMFNKIMPDVVIDVGVNKSFYLEIYAQIANSVIGFEPLPTEFTEMADDIKLRWPKERITVYPYALWDCNKTDKFYVCKPDSCYSVGDTTRRDSLIDWELFTADDFETIEVEYRTLDSLNVIGNDRQLHLIKVDSESNDIVILNGAINTIKKHHPIIQLEHVVDDNEDVLPDCLEFMKSINYKQVRPWFSTTNVFFIPDKMKDISNEDTH